MIRNQQSKGMLLMLGFTLMDASAGALIKLIPWNPFITAGFRGLLAFCLLWIYYRFNGIRLTINYKTFLGGCMISSMFISFVAATRLTSAANAALLQYTNPIFIIVLSWLLFKQKPKKLDICTALVAFGGMAVMMLGVFSENANSLTGSFLAIFSGLAFAGMFLMGNRFKRKEDHISALLMGHLITFAVGMFFLLGQVTVKTGPGLSFDSLFTEVISTGFIPVTAVFALGVFQQAIPNTLYAKAIRITQPLGCSLVSMLGPVLNPLLVFLFIGEKPSVLTIIGGGVIFVSVGAWSLSTINKEKYSN